MKTKTGKITLVAILAMLVVAMLPMSVLAINVSTDKSTYAPGELVTINGNAAPNALVSIQVRNPLASLIYADVVTATAAGAYTSSFGLPVDAPTGAYTVDVSATEGTDQTTFTVGEAVPSFSVTVLPSTGTVPQGGSISASVTVTAIAGYDQTVTLSATGQPTGVTISFSPTTSTPTFTSTMSVSAVSTVVPGAYTITVTGTGADTTVQATYTLTVTSAAAPGELTVDLSKSSGHVGDKITVSGNASPWSIITLYWEDLSGQVLGTTAADSTGAYEKKKVTIPPAVNGPHYIVVSDGTATAGAVFTVTASLKASTTPSTKDTTYNAKVLPGDALTLTGNGFSKKETVTITFTGPAGTLTLTVPTITTDDTGSFSAVVTVPATILVTQYGAYTVTATDAENVAAGALILVDYYNTVTPTRGPPGITITISGRIPANTAYSLLIDDTTILTGTSGTDGKFSQTYTIPALIAQGAHSIIVRWTVATVVNTRDVTFTVSPAPTLTKIVPTYGVPGKVVTISGAGFSTSANITIYLDTTIVNSTQLDDRFGPTHFITGAFTNLEFTVPTLAAGVYTLTVTDEYGASTGTVYTFTVKAAPVTTIALRATSYYRGDTLSFNIVTTDGFTAGPAVTIKDPTGSTWWTTTWTLTGTVTMSVYFQDQLINNVPLMLPADAPLGTWNWTITYTPASTAVSTKATALFTVSALPTMQTVLDQLDTMEASIKSVVTTSEGKIIVAVNTKAGTIMTDLDAIGAKLQGIEDVGIIIATDVGEIKIDIAALDLAALDALGVDITSIKGSVATIKTNIGTVTTSVSNLDAKVTSLSGSVATVSTSLGTLQGTVTSIEGNVATISTDVGTIEADISDISKVDMTPAWLAVVLSLVAAIAAIFAVITIRQKIAG